MQVDLIIESERVFTGTSSSATPGAVAVSGDRIVAAGPQDDVRAFAAQANTGVGSPEIRNFGDALVVPGFHDSHLHFFHSAVYSSPLATTFLGENEADCVARMQRLAERRPSGWLLAQ
ncbi:MAG: amidohydrolase, partial [Raoultibacter sp.]